MIKPRKNTSKKSNTLYKWTREGNIKRNAGADGDVQLILYMRVMYSIQFIKLYYQQTCARHFPAAAKEPIKAPHEVMTKIIQLQIKRLSLASSHHCLKNQSNQLGSLTHKMGILSCMLSCFSPSSSARVDHQQNAKEERLSIHHSKSSKSSRSTAPIPVSYFPVNSRLSFL